MKQMKFFLVALMAVVMGLSVTSCMNGDDNTIVQRTDFVRVVQDFPVYFKNMAGDKLVPTSVITTSETMALIYYQYDRATVAENANSVTITLLAEPSYIKEGYATTSPYLTANAPVMTLEPSTAYGAVKGGFFDKNTILLPVAYKIKMYEKEEDMKAELNRHTFELSYDSETGFKDGVLTLRLKHNAQAIESESGDGQTVERKDNTYEYKAFGLSAVLRSLSSTPTKINIVIDQNENNDKFGEGYSTEKTFPYEYQFTE
ncbi:hypothetical protein [Bacteroides sp.]|uniref:hypothetical protein n=1 Tax=Bacteroides sp. TaxID=29523 RepID=UPI0025BD8747|nr:hypothetical protein [Bacteroides sp.]